MFLASRSILARPLLGLCRKDGDGGGGIDGDSAASSLISKKRRVEKRVPRPGET